MYCTACSFRHGLSLPVSTTLVAQTTMIFGPAAPKSQDPYAALRHALAASSRSIVRGSLPDWPLLARPLRAAVMLGLEKLATMCSYSHRNSYWVWFSSFKWRARLWYSDLIESIERPRGIVLYRFTCIYIYTQKLPYHIGSRLGLSNDLAFKGSCYGGRNWHLLRSSLSAPKRPATRLGALE